MTTGDPLMTDRSTSCTGCSRRDFLAVGSLAAVSMFLTACGGDGGGPTSLGEVNVTLRPADYPALAVVGGIARVQGIAAPVAVVRTADAAYRAFSMICPHQGTVIAINGAGFRCPNHGATFNGTGAWIGGQRTSGLFELSVRANASAGTITITT